MVVDVRSLPFPINVVSVLPLEGHRLELEFEVGKECKRTRGVFDMSAYLDWPAFRSLADESVFRKVFSDGYTACWPGEIDIAPERLYTDMVPLEEPQP